MGNLGRCCSALAASALLGTGLARASNGSALAPKVIMITFYDDEGDSFLSNTTDFDFSARNVTVPGASPQFPSLHCTADAQACLFTTGEGMTNAGNSIMALTATPGLDLTKTYFVTGGVAGGNPKVVSSASVILARFTVQPALQYEIDAREMPASFGTGYFPQGGASPADAWGYLYNTEVFAVNDALRDRAAALIDAGQLVDSADARAYRAQYLAAGTNGSSVYAAGAAAPGLVKCDIASTDVWWSGALLGDSFADRTTKWTNGTGIYCATAQEDGAVAAALLRGALAGKVDYNRIVMMRSISDYDRPYTNQTVVENLVYADPGSYDPSISNIHIAGVSVLKGILGAWNSTFEAGIVPTRYTGDLWGTLGGTPDFGPGRESSGSPVSIPEYKRSLNGRTRRARKAKHHGL